MGRPMGIFKAYLFKTISMILCEIVVTFFVSRISVAGGLEEGLAGHFTGIYLEMGISHFSKYSLETRAQFSTHDPAHPFVGFNGSTTPNIGLTKHLRDLIDQHVRKDAPLGLSVASIEAMEKWLMIHPPEAVTPPQPREKFRLSRMAMTT
jgi:hypothetical protein